jgi:lipid-A-disaccharide synthase-like uncharacterized protein
LKAATKLHKTASLGSGLVAIVAGAVLFVLGSDDMKLVGIVLVSMSPVILSRVLRDKLPASRPIYDPPVTQLDAVRSSWPLAVACGVLVAGSFYVLHLDAEHGHDEVAPVLFFAFSGLCGIAYLIYIFGRITNRANVRNL